MPVNSLMLKIAWNEHYAHSLPPGHRFPMEKYDLLPEQLLYEGTISSHNLFSPSMLSEEHIVRTHQTDYWKKLQEGKLSRSEIRKTGFPFSEALVKRERIIMQGTLEAAQFALQHGVAMNVAGGTHHAFTDRGEGFCLLNDIAIAANYLLDSRDLQRILVIDLDVHQGNGTAQIFKDEPRVFTFSMHGEKNYPLQKEVSDLDIALPDGTADKQYIRILERELSQVLDQVDPQFIFYQSGVDILESDTLGRLRVSLNGCRERDQYVLDRAREARVPLVASMGGGYSKKISDIIEAHANTYRLAQELFF